MATKQTKPARRPKAATADILGSAPDNARVPVKWRKHFTRLKRLRDDLLNNRSDLVKDATEEQPTFSLHIADAGTDSFDRDFALSRISSEQDAVYEIDEALRRIYTRTYGICEVTGKPIEPERLTAIPWTRFCRAAEMQLEKEGATRRSRLAPREALARGANADNEADDSTDEQTSQE